MKMNELLKQDYVFFDVTPAQPDKKSALETFSALCAQKGGFDQKALLDEFLAREELDSTGFGEGIAIPHAKIPGLTNPMIAVARFTCGMDWDAIDDEPVEIAIGLIMPKGDTQNLHVDVLSAFARKLVHEDFTQGLKGAKNAQELYDFIIREMED